MSKKSVQELFVELVRNLSEAKDYMDDPNKYLATQGIVLAEEQKAALDSALKNTLKRATGPGGHHRNYDIHMNTELLDPHEDYTQHLDATS
jgi:hypothetical protein